MGEEKWPPEVAVGDFWVKPGSCDLLGRVYFSNRMFLEAEPEVGGKTGSGWEKPEVGAKIGSGCF